MLVGMAFIPAVSAQTEDNYSVTADEAFEHANTRIIALIVTENNSEKWEGTSIDPKPLELYDISGQKLYYEFSVYNKNTLISPTALSPTENLSFTPNTSGIIDNTVYINDLEADWNYYESKKLQQVNPKSTGQRRCNH